MLFLLPGLLEDTLASAVLPLSLSCLTEKALVQVTEGRSCSSLSSSYMQETFDDLGQEKDLQSEPAVASS